MKRIFLFNIIVLALLVFFAAATQAQPQGARRKPAPESIQKRDYRQLTPQQMAEALDFIRESNPQKADQLEALRSANPDSFQCELGSAHQRMMHWQNLKMRDPRSHARQLEIIRLEEDARQLGKRMAQAPEAEKADIKNELQPILEKLFDLREEERHDEVKHLEKRIEVLKDRLNDRQKNRDRIIQKRLENLSTSKKMQNNQ